MEPDLEKVRIKHQGERGGGGGGNGRGGEGRGGGRDWTFAGVHLTLDRMPKVHGSLKYIPLNARTCAFRIKMLTRIWQFVSIGQRLPPDDLHFLIKEGILFASTLRQKIVRDDYDIGNKQAATSPKKPQVPIFADPILRRRLEPVQHPVRVEGKMILIYKSKQ